MSYETSNLTNLLGLGNKILTGQVSGLLNPQVGAWIEYVTGTLRSCPRGEIRAVEWLGLPTPHARLDASALREIADEGFQRAMQERCKWLSETIKELMETEAARDASTRSVSPPKHGKPALFIGSSVEGLKYARGLEKQLEHHADVTIWKDGVFGLGGGSLESLVNVLPDFDFAVLVLTPDDLIASRDVTKLSPRDNVIFELGLFMGRLGRFRTFVVYNQDTDIKLPSDLAGVTAAKFRNRADGNYHAQVSSPGTSIIDAIEKHGKFQPS
ncbi:MAG TPA: TIR domain-containing protein [Tepidisphaeraceae bacterium]